MTKLEPTRTSSDLTATERLRRMLDERGVEWTEGIARPELTQVRIDGKVVKFHPWQPNTLKVSLFGITPEQAVAATLGRGTCRLPETRIDHGSIEYNGVTEWRKCSTCGTEVLAYPARFCPNCGRKVVDE